MDSENLRQQEHSDAVTASPLDLLDGSGAGRDHRLMRISNDGLSAREMPVGNIYSSLNLGGQTRAILGNVFYTTHNTVTNPSEQTAEGKRHESLMDTLAFDRMGFRKATVEPAHTRTCQWIFEEEAFLRWRDPEFREANHGFLWIKGKPGSGKSTLMKCILDHMTKHAPECKFMSFFFNARGEHLERSTEGCYRSLLHQMLQQFPRLHDSIRIPQPLSEGQASPIVMLQNVFHEAVLSLQHEKLVVMIDALDECDQKEIRSMVQFFGSLADAAELEGVTLNTCFASRHYPSITVRFCDTLLMENSKGHTQDIFLYARDSLIITPDVQREKMLDQVMQKAEGVFLWVVLVVRTLNEQFDEGRSHAQLLDAISELPDDLDALIGSILSNGASDQHLLPTLIWVLSVEAKTSDMTYAAIKLGAGDTSHFQETRSHSPSFVSRFVLHASKGLVGLSLIEDCPDVPQELQFIHESVRQYILTKGLAQLDSTFASNVEAARHAYLAKLYGTFLRHYPCPLRTHDRPLEFPLSSTTTSHQWQDYFQALIDTDLGGEYDPLDVAQARFWIHMKEAYYHKAFVLEHLHDFPKSQYIHITNSSRCLPLRPAASFLYLLLSREPRALGVTFMYRLAKDLFKHCATCMSTVSDGLGGSPAMSCCQFLLGRDLDDYCGGRFGTSLIAALAHESTDLSLLLLNAGADVNICSGGKGPTACREMDLWSPLSTVVIYCYDPCSAIELLLDRGADINIRSRIHGSALGAAAFWGQETTVKLLLDRKADVNLEDSEGCNIALKEALSVKDNTEIVEILVRAGAYAKVGSMDHVEFKAPYRFC